MLAEQRRHLNEHFLKDARITKGEGYLGTIYDRLRKASLRRVKAADRAWDKWMPAKWMAGATLDDWFDNRTLPSDTYCCEDHAVYLSGVLDALKAVQNRPKAPGYLP